MAEAPLACRLTTPELRERRDRIAALLRCHLEERQAAPNGYRLRFRPEPTVLGSLAGLIEAERECCPFLGFQLTAEPADGPLWLEITGPEGTREFLDTELGLAAAP